MTSHLSDEQRAAVHAPHRTTLNPDHSDCPMCVTQYGPRIERIVSEHVEAAERALVERVAEAGPYTLGCTGPAGKERLLGFLLRAALAGDSSHSGTGEPA